MPDPVSSIRNIGPAGEVMFKRAGINDAETLRNLGADESYKRLLATGTQPHFIGYYSLVMGLQGRPWNDCQGAEKAALRLEFDQIKSNYTPVKPVSEIEKHLNILGVIN
ncbi:MAG: TfoX/Sxy family protein [Rhodobacteraceae bacterium]|nr:TfoX/Sxy family protein [Paracoccaceae bacterium]